MMKFSIIIPAKNEGKYIDQCLLGLKNLDYDNSYIEIIVVDNGSTDNTIEIAQKYNVKLLHSPVSSISELRNIGASKATGDILGFLDADCIVNKNWLKRGKLYFSTTSDIVMIGAIEIPPKYGATWVETVWSQLKHGPKPKTGFRYSHWCASGAMLVRKSIFFKVDGFNNTFKTCEDYDLCQKILRYGKIIIDYTIPFEHLRGSKTLRELFDRERWRGRDNFKGLLLHEFNIKELPSILFPFLYLIVLSLSFCLIFLYPFEHNFKKMSIFLAIISLIFPTLMAIKKLGFPLWIKTFIRADIVCFVYLLARGVGSIFRGQRKW